MYNIVYEWAYIITSYPLVYVVWPIQTLGTYL